MLLTIDDLLPDPVAYRAEALGQAFKNITLGNDTFCGIAPCRRSEVTALAAEASGARPVLSFFRRSPKGQQEPNYIHSDELMGRFTGIYYMNPMPEPNDGTAFWEKNGDDWKQSRLVLAKFNRLLLFDAAMHHSRAIFDNYGSGDNARLIQVVFLR